MPGVLQHVRLVALMAGLILCSHLSAHESCELKHAIATLPLEYQAAVRDALLSSGGNQPELIAAIHAVKPEQRRALAFILANMPSRDLLELKHEFLIENAELAFDARKNTPWGESLPEEIFQNYVLPYANLNEKRESWRRDFRERFWAEVKECKTSSEAALKLNHRVFEILNVRYHPTKRPKPDQSPSESMQAGYASCTGLSILFADACRAVSIPARVVAIPEWTVPRGDKSGNHRGNHTWVEIWDGQWHVLGASEVTELDRTWFMGSAAEADPERPEHCVYAASFRKTAITFPLIWDSSIDYVRADDVTRFYCSRRAVELRVLDRKDGSPARANLTIHSQGRLVADMPVNGEVVLTLGGGQDYEATLSALLLSVPATQRISISETQKEPVVLYLNK